MVSYLLRSPAERRRSLEDSIATRESARGHDGQVVAGGPEKAVLVGVQLADSAIELSASMDELQQLAVSAGVQVVGRVSQKLDEPNPRHYIGKGKLEELATLCDETAATMVIFDDELRPHVQLELERVLGLRVIDRTLLILDIFAHRAHTHEGRVQVELAQYQYLLPRLVGRGTELSRLGGGIGTRGPGETKLEFDRRRMRQRITRLEKEIEAIRLHRQVHRESRRTKELPLVALIGYTNAGKSTLLNRLTGSEVEVADKLFATLDPTTRRLELPSGQEVLASDTVGFIAKLPTALVAAFRATLEELEEADLLLEVVDITDSQAEQASRVVQGIVADLGLREKPTLTVLNKADRLMPPEAGTAEDPVAGLTPEALGMEPVPDTVLISAEKGWGIEALKRRIEEMLNAATPRIEVLIPYGRSDLVDLFRRKGSVEVEEHTPEGTLMRGRLPARHASQFRSYEVRGTATAGRRRGVSAT
ncbi:MAG: GTPase HflX [Chloroflexota bacterium]